MKAWAKGETAARVDPALAALATSIVDIAVTFGVHDQLGLTPEQLLTTLLHIAVILTVLRTFQLTVPRKSVSEPEADPVPEAEPVPEPDGRQDTE